MLLGIALTFAAGIIRMITAIPGISNQLSKSEQYWLCFVSQILNGKKSYFNKYFTYLLLLGNMMTKHLNVC